MAIFYHGTTRRRAQHIRERGFKPRPPSRRVWFARHRSVAERRARQKAGRAAGDHPVVLVCDIDLGALTAALGSGRVFHARNILSVRGAVPASVLRHDAHDGRQNLLFLELPDEASGLARWLNRLLELAPHKGISRKHPGVQRLVQWLRNRTAVHPEAVVAQSEIAEVAARWLPEFFAGVAIDPARMRILRYRGSAAGDRTVLEPAPAGGEDAADDTEPADGRETEVLECLTSPTARRRVRGLHLLADLEAAEDLAEWCLLFVDDDDVEVAVAALESLANRAESVNPFLIEDLAADPDRRLRAAALEVLAAHDEAGASRWLWEGLTDPEPHVRMRLVRHIDRLDPAMHPDIFETALTDPNPEVARLARRRSQGRGIGVPTW